MTTPATKNSNATLAISLMVGGAVLLLVMIAFLYFAPAETLEVVNNVNVKALLLVLGFLFITAIGVLLYWAFYSPTVRRLTVVGWRAVLVYSAVAGGFSTFGWPRIASINLNDEAGLDAKFSAVAATLEVWPTLTVCFGGIGLMTLIYILVGVLEAKLGQEL